MQRVPQQVQASALQAAYRKDVEKQGRKAYNWVQPVRICKAEPYKAWDARCKASGAHFFVEPPDKDKASAEEPVAPWASGSIWECRSVVPRIATQQVLLAVVQSERVENEARDEISWIVEDTPLLP